MELYSGMPWWLVKNRLRDYHNPLQENIHVPVAIIGSGVTGALVAHYLCEAGIDCCIVDKRSVSTGSTSASTALLQYEIDLPLCKMRDKIGEENAAKAFGYCIKAIADIEKIFGEIGYDPSFRRVPSVYFASNAKGEKIIKEEYELRRKYDLPVRELDRDELYRIMNIDAPGALINDVSAQLDAYQASTGLLSYNMENRRLKVYSHTGVRRWRRTKEGYDLETDRGYKIKCEWLVVAAGFEAGPFIPKKAMELTTTFAIISKPVDPNVIWHKHSLIWETRDPYLYIRTDGGNRIIVGGEDEDFNDPERRVAMMAKKSRILERKIKKMFPRIPFQTEFRWSGTFSNTHDGLPIIGATDDNPRMLYALGYGGNGITFSVMAGQMLRKRIAGEEDERDVIFGLKRKSMNL